MNKKILLIILILAFGLRFYKLGQIPKSLDWDENSNAYNAYSILKTGRDEYGTFLPIANRSFDDYKPPLYMYLNVPAVALFGLTPFAARLPSAIFGFLTVPAVYLLTRFLLRNYGSKLQETTALTATFFLAISPWHLQFSRVGFESTVGLFLAVASITAFLYGLRNKRLLIASSIFLGLSAYSYHTERIFVPLLFVATAAIYRQEILTASKKYLLLFTVFTILIALPLVILIPPKVILERFQTTTGRPRLEDIDKSIKFQNQDNNTRLSRIIHNRRVTITQTLVANYLSHFDFNFLFTQGDDNPRHHIGNMGMIYLFELPLLLIALYLLLKNPTKESIFIISWLLIAPIAATPATPNPHANRALPLIIPLEIASAYSVVFLYQQNFFAKRKFLFLATVTIAGSFLYYLHNYYIHYPIDDAGSWQFGYSEAAQSTEKLKNNFEKVDIDSSIEQAYIFWLFNTRYDPASYQKSGSRLHFDKYYFEQKAPANAKELYVSTAAPSGFAILDTIYYPDGRAAAVISHPLNK